MNTDNLFTLKDARTLKEARKIYGAQKELGVAAEECTELAKELIKVFRYDDPYDMIDNTKGPVLEELADVIIVMDHILHIYCITEEELRPYIAKKMKRLRYWLENSNSLEFTTNHRDIDEGQEFTKYQQKFYNELRAMDE